MIELILKDCPHCGGESYLESNYSYKTRRYFVMAKCSICGSQGKIYNCKTDPAADDWQNSACDAAAAAWNMRTTDHCGGKVNGKK